MIRIGRNSLAATVLTTALAAALALPATALADNDGTDLPVGANPTAWQRNYQATPAGWLPRGTIVADSGFRPFPNGFSFFNIGVPDTVNHSVFGVSKRPPGLTGADVRSLFGPGVCLAGNATGRCTPTLPARRWIATANELMAGGHCFGFAVTASLLNDGELTPSQFQTAPRGPTTSRCGHRSTRRSPAT